MNSPRFTFPKTLAALAAAVVLTSSGFAATLKLTTNGTSNGNGLGGGSYTASDLNGLDTSAYASISLVNGAGTFETFCLEYNEHFASGGTYYYDSNLSNVATLGGVSVGADGGPGGDPISKATAWLYSQFATGTLSDFYYNSTDNGGNIFANRKAANNALQLAIWYFEDETGGISGYQSYGLPGQNVFIDAAVGIFGASAKLADDGSSGVKVLNLRASENGAHKQSQLYIAPTKNVPDAASTLGLLALGLGGLAAVRRFGKRCA